MKVSFPQPLSSPIAKQFFVEVGQYCKKCTCCADFRRKYKITINTWELKAHMIYTSGSAQAFDDYKLTVNVAQLPEDKFLRISFIYDVYMNGRFKHDIFYYYEIDAIVYNKKVETLVSNGNIFYIKFFHVDE